MRRRLVSTAIILVAAGALTTLGLTPAAASSPQLAPVVSQTPVSWTPNVSAGTTVGGTTCNATFFGSGGLTCQSEVYDTAYVNGDVVAVGAFTEVCKPGKLSQGLCTPGTQVTRDDIFAYQAGTGLIDPNFVPVLNSGPGWTVIPGPAGSNTVYVGGNFSTVDGASHKGLVQLNVNPGVTTGSTADGSIVTGFKASVSKQVKDLALSPDGTALYAGGQFSSADSQPASGLVRFNAKTGALDTSFSVTLSDPVSGDALQVEAMDLSQNGSLLAFSGTALQVDGQSRPRLAIVDTGGTLGSAASLADFTAPILSNNCSAEHDYVRALSFAPDGSFLVIANTGYQNDGSMPFSTCDAAARFDVSSAAAASTGTTVDVAPSWINYGGGDSFYSVVAAGNTVYAGGHQRWVDNYCGNNNVCEQNAVLVNGLSALDANTGMAVAYWHPETLRGHGTMYLNTFGTGSYDGSKAGLALGTDVDVEAGSYHAENAIFPLTGTATAPGGPIPSGLFNTEDGSNTGHPLCVDDPGNSSTSGTAAEINGCLNIAEQTWSVPVAGSTGEISVNGLCLATAGGGTSSGTKVELDTCNSGTATQQWTQGTGNTVTNSGAGSLCLDDPSGSTTPGTQLDIATCDGGAEQVWPLPVAPGPPAGPAVGPVFPNEEQSDTQVPCLDDANDSTVTGNKVQLWQCRGEPQQNWTTDADGTFRLQGSFCLDTAGGGTAQGTLVVLDPCNGSPTQVWKPGTNNQLVQQAGTDQCLDDPGFNVNNGTQLQIYPCNGGKNQQWWLPGV